MSGSLIRPPVNPLTFALNGIITRRIFSFWMLSSLPNYTAVITSTGRQAEHNAAVGGVEDSAHLYNLAIDFVLKEKATGRILPEAEARTVFLKAAPTWPGYALFEPADTAQGYHIHLNISRTMSVAAGIVSAAAVVVVATTTIRVFVRDPKKRISRRGRGSRAKIKHLQAE